MKKPKITEDDIREACLVAGFFMVGGGLWLIYPPMALIICGLMLLWLGLPPRQRRVK